MESCSVCFGPEIFKAKYIMSVLKYQYTPKIDHIKKKCFLLRRILVRSFILLKNLRSKVGK